MTTGSGHPGPTSVSLIGYDGNETTRMLIPPITRVAQDQAALAREATVLLLRVREGHERRFSRLRRA